MYDQLSTPSTDEPLAKRRKVDPSEENGLSTPRSLNGAPAAAGSSERSAASEPVLLEIKDISVTVPQRKKYNLCFTENFLYARTSASAVPVQGTVYAWRDIGMDTYSDTAVCTGPTRWLTIGTAEHAFYLPIPEKSQIQHNYLLLPRGSSLPSKTTNTIDTEPLVFSVPSSAPKPGSISGPSANAASAVSDSHSSLFHWALTTCLRSAGNRDCQLVASDPKIFHSATKPAYRPNEKAVYVKAFRGSKDGYLFFLPTGILWGFKKPLLFLPLDRIVAVSYTSVLQRTFNMVVEVEAADGGDNEEVEFAMVDQEDYQNIDETYVKRHGLQDRSMAEQRKARRELAENAKDGKKKDDGAADGAANGDVAEGDDGLTELERARLEAERQLQDEEDESEEDYDPGSEGESEGSGDSSDEDDNDGGDGEGYDDEEEEDDDDDEEEAEAFDVAG